MFTSPTRDKRDVPLATASGRGREFARLREALPGRRWNGSSPSGWSGSFCGAPASTRSRSRRRRASWRTVWRTPLLLAVDDRQDADVQSIAAHPELRPARWAARELDPG
jgi:hypothetical protein